MDNRGLFQNGITAKQYDCTLNLTNGCIYIYVENETKDLLIWDLKSLYSCHLNGSHLIVKYGGYPHQTLECRGEIANAIYRAWSGSHVIRHAEAFTFKSKKASMLIFILAFLGLGVFAFLVLIPWLGEKAANLVPIETEVKLGENIADMYEHEGKVNDSATYYVDRFVKLLELDNTYQIEAKVIESKDINAFALPGGKIFIYSGIIDEMNSYEELVALLGHEVTHVVNRHSLKGICRSAATGIFIASLFGDVTGISSGILSQADEFRQLHYSRELETEADNNGVTIMVENHVSPQGMIDLLKLLKTESTQMPQFMKYLSTHPDTDSRIENVESNPEAKASFPENQKLQALFTKLKRCI